LFAEDFLFTPLSLLVAITVICLTNISQLFQRDECMRKIRELGSLPSDAFEKYQGFGIKQASIASIMSHILLKSCFAFNCASGSAFAIELLISYV